MLSNFNLKKKNVVNYFITFPTEYFSVDAYIEVCFSVSSLKAESLLQLFEINFNVLFSLHICLLFAAVEF